MKMEKLKISVVGGSIALLLLAITLPAHQANAATRDELLIQIQNLIAQVQALQAQILNQPTDYSCSVFSGNLTIGATGSEVVNLQNFLISRGYNIPAGATGYFGEQTRKALANFQISQGISPAYGYFGPITRARIQSLCIVIDTPDTPETPTETETLSGEATIERFEVKDGDDTDLEEEDRNKEILEASFRVYDGDVRITHIDLGFTPDNNNDENDPWDTFKTVSIWEGSKKIAETDATDEENWREDTPDDGDYRVRLSGLSYIIEEDEEVDWLVKTSIQNHVKGTENGEVWNVFIPTNGIKGIDADNAVVYAGDTVDAVTLNIDEVGSTDELLVRRSDEDPDATTLQLDDNSRSDFMTVFAFDIDTDDSKNDIMIRELPIYLTVSSSTLSTFMRDIRIEIDGDTYDDQTTIDGTTGTIAFEFDRNELVIDAGDRVTAIVEVRFNALEEMYEGATIYGSVAASEIDAEGRDDLDSDQLAGRATGESHTMATHGGSISNDTDNEATSIVSVASGDNNDYATFELSFSLTAFGQDVYVPIGPSGMTYKLTDAIGNTLPDSGTVVTTATADEEGNYFFIPEGETEILTITVTYQPGVANTVARLQLVSVNYSNSEQLPTQSWVANPANDYRTPAVTIVN